MEWDNQKRSEIKESQQGYISPGTFLNNKLITRRYNLELSEW